MPDQDRGRLEAKTNKWDALPATNRELIEGLHEDDVIRLKLFTDLLREKGGTDRDGRPSIDKVRQGMEMVETVATMGRWSKWVFLAAVALAGGIVSFLALYDRIKGMFTGGGRP